MENAYEVYALRYATMSARTPYASRDRARAGRAGIGCRALLRQSHRRSPFPIVYYIGDMCQGWEIVERLAGHPDRIIPGHDPEIAAIYPRASDKVDAFALHLKPSRSFVK